MSGMQTQFVHRCRFLLEQSPVLLLHGCCSHSRFSTDSAAAAAACTPATATPAWQLLACYSRPLYACYSRPHCCTADTTAAALTQHCYCRSQHCCSQPSTPATAMAAWLLQPRSQRCAKPCATPAWLLLPPPLQLLPACLLLPRPHGSCMPLHGQRCCSRSQLCCCCHACLPASILHVLLHHGASAMCTCNCYYSPCMVAP